MTINGILDDLVSYSHHKSAELDVAGLIAAGTMGRNHRGLGGSHTVVTYPPLNALSRCDARDVTADVKAERGIHLYTHIAYCEFQCPFCHYETEATKLGSRSDHKTIAYMDAMRREWRCWAERLQGSSLSSLYVGGGTPTSIAPSMLVEFLELVLGFRREKDFAFCVETSPQTAAGDAGHAILDELTNLGATRFSIGVQTTNDRLLKRSRGHDLNTLHDAMDNMAATGVDFNVDLIQDLPDQDDDCLIEDLRFVDRFRPAQVTWYIMRLDANASWHQRFSRNAIDISSSCDSARRRLMIIEGMRRLGYVSGPGGRFQRSKDSSDGYKRVRSGLSETLLGIGASAYSHGWGWFFRNTYSQKGTNGIRDYIDRVRKGDGAICDGVRTTREDEIVSRCINGIRSRLEFGNDLSEVPEYAQQLAGVVDTLLGAGLAERDGEAISLTSLGQAFEEEICTMLFPNHIRTVLEERTAN